jgi:hypothetical protein
MDWKVLMPRGAACYVNVDGSLQIRFDSSQVDTMVQWVRDWVLLFEQYANARRPGGTHRDLGPMPKTAAEIQQYVDKLNLQLKLEREGVQPSVAKTLTVDVPMGEPETLAAVQTPPTPAKLVQCPKCMGMRVFGPTDEVCDRCQGAGAING